MNGATGFETEVTFRAAAADRCGAYQAGTETPADGKITQAHVFGQVKRAIGFEELDHAAFCGILVIPVGPSDVQIMTSVIRISETEYETREHGAFRFVPMLENKAREK